MVSPDVKVLKNGQVLSTWHQVQLNKAHDIYRRAVREALHSMEVPTESARAPAASTAVHEQVPSAGRSSTSLSPDSAPSSTKPPAGSTTRPAHGDLIGTETSASATRAAAGTLAHAPDG